MPGIEYLPAGGAGGGGTGPQGPRGYSILHGKGAPAPALGNDEEFYYDEEAKEFYGPKTLGSWGVGFAMKGVTGATGEKGEKGLTGTTGEKGEFTFRGAYNAGTTYAKGDVVREAGTSYVAIKSANTGHTPSALGEWWEVLAEKGATGPEGGGGFGAWTTITPAANWTNGAGGSFHVLEYRTAPGNKIELRGVLERNTSAYKGETVFTLPGEAKPAKNVVLPMYGSGVKVKTITPVPFWEIASNGEVSGICSEVGNFPAVAGRVSFDGLSYSTT